MDRLHGPDHKFARTPGAPFGRPKRHQNRSQNDQKSKRKIKTKQNRSKTILDPSWGDLGPSWGAILGLKTPQTIMKRIVSWTITFSILRWFEDGSGTNLGRKRCPKDRKRYPRGTQRSTPKQPEVDTNIDMNFNANPRGARHFWSADIGPGTPPPGAPGRRPRDPGEAAQAPWDL